MSFPFKDLSFSGMKFRVHGLSAEDRYFLMLHDNMESEFTRFCHSFIRPDYTCFDVGANIGLKSLIIGAQAHAGQVVAIEPGPTVGKVLDLNIRSNGATNVAIEKVAIGDRTGGTVCFHEDSAFGFVADTGVDVPMTTLAALAKARGLPRVDFVKIDVEGLEFQILKESIDFINSNETLVYFEFNAWAQMVNADVRPKEFARWILGNFEHVYLVKKFGEYGNLLSRIRRDDWYGILQQNCFSSTFVDDIVVTNAAWRFDTEEAQRDAAVAERNQALAERDAALAMRESAIAERDAQLAQLEAIRNSTSWKVTSGLRAIGRVLRPRS